MASSSNFSFLAEHDPVFLQLATTAEQVFAPDDGAKQLGVRLGGRLLAGLDTIADALWPSAA